MAAHTHEYLVQSLQKLKVETHVTTTLIPKRVGRGGNRFYTH